MRQLTWIAIALCWLVACADHPEPGFEPFNEPALSAAELAELPDGLADHVHDDGMLIEGVAEDDAAVFDDDAAELLLDEEVFEDASTVTAAAPQPLLASGLHPRASTGLRAAGVSAWRITQTIGHAAASAGYHEQDGSVNGKPYTAAVDLSVRDMSSQQIHNLLERLAKVGFAAWYRTNGRDGWVGATHIHAVYANCKMKSVLRAQVRSWLVGRNGLSSNTLYNFHHFSATAKGIVKGKFAQSGSGTSNGGAGVSARVNTSGAALTIRASATSNAAATGSVADGAFVTISCQKTGQSITGTYGTSTLWDKISGGFVADAYISTGSDGRVAPLCN